MTVNAWLTPDTALFSESHEERTISLPGSLWYLIGGALDMLADAGNWEEIGDATPEESAQFFANILDDFHMSAFRNVGMISAFCSTSLPDKWLEMNGQTLAQADYPELAAVVHSSWKSGDNFTIPLMEDAFIAHHGDTALLGRFSGANTHALTSSQMPTHSHTYARRQNTIFVQSGSGGVVPHIEATANTGNAGSGSAHNNMPRNLGVMFAIYAGR